MVEFLAAELLVLGSDGVAGVKTEAGGVVDHRLEAQAVIEQQVVILVQRGEGAARVVAKQPAAHGEVEGRRFGRGEMIEQVEAAAVDVDVGIAVFRRRVAESADEFAGPAIRQVVADPQAVDGTALQVLPRVEIERTGHGAQGHGAAANLRQGAACVQHADKDARQGQENEPPHHSSSVRNRCRREAAGRTH